MIRDTDDLPLVLHLHDVDPETAERIRGKARARFCRRPSVISHAYNRILEPVLVLGTVVASLSWALSRVNFLSR
jgi:hypothetical protein